MSSVCEKYQLKHLEYDILMFLHNNPQYRTAADCGETGYLRNAG